MFGLLTFRSRRRARSAKSLVIAVPLILVWLGYDHYQRSQQTKEEWNGTIVRQYQERPFLGSSRSTPNRYWDVRTGKGEVRTVRVYARSLWNDGIPGNWVIKRTGELDPAITRRR